MADDVVLRTSGLVKRFGTLTAVDHIDLEVRRGEVVGLLGPTAAGKSTTIGMVLGSCCPRRVAPRSSARTSRRIARRRSRTWRDARGDDLLTRTSPAARTRSRRRPSAAAARWPRRPLLKRPRPRGARRLEVPPYSLGCASASASPRRSCRIRGRDPRRAGERLDPAGQREIRELVRELAKEGLRRPPRAPSAPRGRARLRPSSSSCRRAASSRPARSPRSRAVVSAYFIVVAEPERARTTCGSWMALKDLTSARRDRGRRRPDPRPRAEPRSRERRSSRARSCRAELARGLFLELTENGGASGFARRVARRTGDSPAA